MKRAAVQTMTLLGACLGAPVFAAPVPAGFAHVYVAQVTETRFVEAARLDTALENSYLVTAGIGRAWKDLGTGGRLEWEAQAARHWGMQDHGEANVFVTARWQRFPWDRIVRSSVGFGSGVSYAFGTPSLENGESDARTLIFLMLEVTGGLPEATRWSVFARIHHRSGLFGRLVDAGSNFVGLGLRRHFE